VPPESRAIQIWAGLGAGGPPHPMAISLLWSRRRHREPLRASLSLEQLRDPHGEVGEHLSCIELIVP
jgi:hypothetical protein